MPADLPELSSATENTDRPPASPPGCNPEVVDQGRAHRLCEIAAEHLTRGPVRNRAADGSAQGHRRHLDEVVIAVIHDHRARIRPYNRNEAWLLERWYRSHTQPSLVEIFDLDQRATSRGGRTAGALRRLIDAAPPRSARDARGQAEAMRREDVYRTETDVAAAVRFGVTPESLRAAARRTGNNP